jgi:hypothetical protein
VFVLYSCIVRTMAAIRFQISTRWTERKRTIQVYVHDTAQELRDAGDKYNRKVGSDNDIGHAVGLCQANIREKLVGDEWVALPDAGIIQLTRNALKTGVISHEATHMASNIYDQDWREKHGAPWDDIENEEILAYLVGDITSKIVRKLYALELIGE